MWGSGDKYFDGVNSRLCSAWVGVRRSLLQGSDNEPGKAEGTDEGLSTWVLTTPSWNSTVSACDFQTPSWIGCSESSDHHNAGWEANATCIYWRGMNDIAILEAKLFGLFKEDSQ